MLALLVAYELGRMSLIKECNSIKSDHSHYPVHLVSLWLGSCFKHAHSHAWKYVWESILKNTRTCDRSRKESKSHRGRKRRRLHMPDKRGIHTHESTMIYMKAAWSTVKQTVGPKHTNTSGDYSTGAGVVLHQMLPRGSITSTHTHSSYVSMCATFK